MRITKENSLVYIALSILCSRDENYMAPELLFILGIEKLETFIKVFGGRNIKVPDMNDFRLDLMTAMFAYHYIVLGNGKKWFKNEYGMSDEEMESISERFRVWIKTVNDGDLGIMKG